MSQKFCTQCGYPLVKNARFCGECGAGIESAKELSLDATADDCVHTVAKAPVPKKARAKKHSGFLTHLITQSLALTLAIFTLTMAFMPLVSLPLDDIMESAGLGDEMFDDADFRLNLFQMTALFIDSFYSLSDEELQDTKIYEEFESSIEQLFKVSDKEYEDLSRKERQAIDNLIFSSLRLSLRSDLTVAAPAFYVSFICAFLYICFVLAFFVLALLSFLGVFGISKLSSKKIKRALYILLSILPLAALLTFGALSFGFGQYIEITAALLLPILFSLPIILWICISRIIFDKVRYTASTLVRRGFALALSMVVFFLAFAPVVNCRYTGVFSDSAKERHMTVTMYAADFGCFIYTDKVIDELNEVHDLTKEETVEDLEIILENIYLLNHRDGDSYAAITSNTDMASHLLAATGLHKFAFLLTLIPVMLLGMMLFALLIIQANLSFFMYGANDAKKAFLSKMMMLSFAALSLILVVAFLVAISLTYKHYLNAQYRTVISAGFVILMIFNIAAVCIPVGKFTAASPDENDSEPYAHSQASQNE